MNFRKRGPWGLTILLLLLLVMQPMRVEAQKSESDLVDLVIVLDRSGSMITTDRQGLSVPAASFILEQLALSNDNNRAAIVPFNNSACILGQKEARPKEALTTNLFGLMEMLTASLASVPFTFRESNPEKPKEFQDLLRTQMREADDTELGMALSLSAEILKADRPGRTKMVVLISDGFPYVHFRDGKRLDDLEPVAGRDLIRRIRQRYLQSDIDSLNTIFAEHILNTVVQSYAKDKISIYPVAFLEEGAAPGAAGQKPGSLVLVDYLRKIKEATTGDREVIVADSSTLIGKLMEFLPSIPGHIQIYSFKGDTRFVRDEERVGSREYELVVPDIAAQSRFFFSYPVARKSQRVRVELFREGNKVADSEGSQNSGVVLSSAPRRDGSTAYQSFKFLHPNAAPGRWRVKLTDASAGKTEHLPDTDFLVDIRSQVELEIDTGAPNNLRAQTPLAFRFKLLGRRGSEPYPLPLTRVDAFLMPPTPAQKLRDFDHEQSVIVAKHEFDKAGSYKLRGLVSFNTVPQTRELSIGFERVLDVLPAVPVDAWFGARGTHRAAAQRNPELRFTLPPLGENFISEFEGVEIETNQDYHRCSLSVSLDPFRHSETGSSLSDKWVKVSPIQLQSIMTDHFIPVKLAVQLPDVVPPRIADGVYESSLHLSNGTVSLDARPLFISISIPRFIHDRTEVNTPYIGEEQEKPMTVEKTIYYPGAIPHRFDIPIWSTSIPGVQAKGYFEIEAASPSPLKEGGAARDETVRYQIESREFPIPGKNDKSPGKIEANVVVTDETLDGKSFENTLTIVGNRHRSKTARLITHLRFIPLWVIYCGAAAFLVLAGLLGMGFYRIFRHRHLFTGYTYDGDDRIQRIVFQGRTIGTFNYDEERQDLTFSGGCFYERRDEVIPLPLPEGSYQPADGDIIYMEGSGRRFSICMLSTPGGGDWGYSYEVQDSALGSGGLQYAYIVPAFFFLAVSSFLYLKPYSIFQWMGF